MHLARKTLCCFLSCGECVMYSDPLTIKSLLFSRNYFFILSRFISAFVELPECIARDVKM